MTLLQVEQLTIAFGATPAVCALNLTVAAGESVALVGESGSGKSATLLAIAGLLPPTAQVTGCLWWEGQDLQAMDPRAYRGRDIAMIFQEPLTALNPLFRCGYQVAEGLMVRQKLSATQARAAAIALLSEVQLPEPERVFAAYPHQLSGGQRQRVTVAMALAGNPRLLLADEPTTALDVTVQAALLDLLRQLQREREMAMIFVTHDLAVAGRIAERVVVMNHGEAVETGPTSQLLTAPSHPYTRGLVACRPPLTHRPARLPVVADFLQDNPPPPPPDISDEEAAQRLAGLMAQSPLLELDKVYVQYGRSPMALRGVDLAVYPGETLGLVGESGCGKTTLLKAILGLVPLAGGTLRLEGVDVATFDRRQRQRFRREVQVVFQDPFGSLDPRMTVGETLAEPLVVHGLPKPERRDRISYLLQRVGLEPAAANRFPHEFSGGQRQRIGIARALALQPRLILADEPVSALDVSVQAQVLNLLKELQAEFGLTLLFVSHDLAVVQFMSDRVAVMHHGSVVEMAPATQVYRQPQHPYTQTLLAAVL
ncbi:MAG TPA: ABC transporter ATP-binding protein [Cyanobacteria bacterium UBA8156]|jgi:peptide/nickel transport system ATP-binding protein|nr:ABC transporter ATP-binding protein [Cyanobacteria bacterium UBA8156]